MTFTVILIFIAAIALVAVLATGATLIARDTRRKQGVWGINTRPVDCPNCENPLPSVRRPKSVHQALWGGWTCGSCGCEVDKWGRQQVDTRQQESA